MSPIKGGRFMQNGKWVALVAVFCLVYAGCSEADGGGIHLSGTERGLREALTLYVSFDNGLDADYAKGDPRLYHSPRWDRRNATRVPGLPEGNRVWLAEGEGRTGNAIRFTGSMPPVVFYHGEKNIPWKDGAWGGTVSKWMRIDPDEDLLPPSEWRSQTGWSDPVQFCGAVWNHGVIFTEFGKLVPRDFRFVIQSPPALWNPNGTHWEEIPVSERPMVQVLNPSFSRERWTHSVFTFENVNSGRQDGIGRFYLDGEYRGTLTGFEFKMTWAPEDPSITLGMHYNGYFDDVAVFDRPLTAEEVRYLYEREGGLHHLVKD
jgi:hypothetical protein